MSATGWTAWQLLSAYLVAFGVFAALDALWLGWLAKDYYRRELGDLMANSPRVLPAVLFYGAFPMAIVYFGLGSLPPQGDSSWWPALLRSAAIGLVAYGTYDLTNLSVTRNFPIKLGVVDMAWGTFASGIAGMAALAAIRWWASRG